jgi:hypothetical protein
MIVHTVIPAFGGLKQEYHDFKAGLGYIARPPSPKKSHNHNSFSKGGR